MTMITSSLAVLNSGYAEYDFHKCFVEVLLKCTYKQGGWGVQVTLTPPNLLLGLKMIPISITAGDGLTSARIAYYKTVGDNSITDLFHNGMSDRITTIDQAKVFRNFTLSGALPALGVRDNHIPFAETAMYNYVFDNFTLETNYIGYLECYLERQKPVVINQTVPVTIAQTVKTQNIDY